MKKEKNMKEAVKEKYAQIATGEVTVQSLTTPSSCCCGGDKAKVVLDMSGEYSAADKAVIPDGADLGLGCGTPVAFAGLNEGMTVLDLGSGAGIDCFVAAKYVGTSGRVIGIDMTEAMIRKANENRAKVALRNVEFRLGEIEALPVDASSVDRVISNCVINLVPDKKAAFKEIFRVLKPNGSFIVSDIVVDGSISEEERRDAALWAGCISGAIGRHQYLAIVREAGFREVKILSEKKYDYRLRSGGGLYSITVIGTR
jgi:arsenite methyltransferase